jgi:hypothetical protein
LAQGLAPPGFSMMQALQPSPVGCEVAAVICDPGPVQAKEPRPGSPKTKEFGPSREHGEWRRFVKTGITPGIDRKILPTEPVAPRPVILKTTPRPLVSLGRRHYAVFP